MTSSPAVKTSPFAGLRRALRHIGALTLTVAMATGLLVGVGAGIASAHVTVNPKSVTAGSYAAITFRVPTESADASTVSIAVSLPTDHPFPSVSTRQMPGWTATMTKVTLDPPVTEGRFTLDEAVSTVTWTADDGVGIKPGEFAEFALSVGPVPDVPTIVLPATQTYSDGSIVKWDEKSSGDDGSEPDHPAPVLTVESAGATAATADAPGSGSDTTAQVLSLVALVLAAIALLVAVLRRRGPAPATRPVDTADGATGSGGEPAGTTSPTSPTE